MVNNQIYSIPNVADLFAKNIKSSARDEFYYVSLLKRIVKTAYLIEDYRKDELIAEPGFVSNEWNATFAGLAEYISNKVFEQVPPTWVNKYITNTEFEPLKNCYNGKYETRVPNEFKKHNVILPEGSLKCLQSFAKERELDELWFNDEVMRVKPPKRDMNSHTIYDKSGLKISIASPEYLLAMKINSFRPNGRDLLDCIFLCNLLGIKTAEELHSIYLEFFNDDYGVNHRIFGIINELERNSIRLTKQSNEQKKAIK